MSDVEGRIVLGLDIARTTEQMNRDLNQVLTSIGKKEITLSAKFENINDAKITSQINNIAKQLNQSLTMKDLKFNVGIEQSNIDRIKKELAGLRISDSGAKELTKEFTSMNVALEKVQHKLVEVKKAEDDGAESAQKLLNLTIQGTTEEGKLVSVTKQYNVETGEIVKTQTAITDNLKAQQQEQDKLARKSQADNDARIKYLTQQRTLLKDIESSYTSSGSSKYVKDDNHLQNLKTQYEAIEAQIRQLESAEGALTQQQRSNISSQIADLKRLAKEYQNAEYVATQLRTKDISPIKEEQLSKLVEFENGLKNSNSLTTEFKNRITELTGQLSNAFDQKTLTGFLNSFDLLKLDVKSFQQQLRYLDAQYKALNTVRSKISSYQIQMVGVDKNSNEYNAINNQLQQQYEYEKRISAEIQRIVSFHPELINYSNEFSKHVIQTSENTAKLATAEAKVADEVERTANAYRTQANNNSFINSIDALETKFLSLKNVSSQAATTMQTDFANLKSLVETIATSTDNTQVVNAYKQYDEIIKKVSNDLDIMARQSKASEQATRDHEKAVKDDAAAQNTLTRSATLSNKIEAWMNQNTKAAQAYGDKLRELQSILANNQNPAMLTSARLEFTKIQSEAKAYGLVTNQFAASIKNTTLQLLGLSSDVMVILKIISVVQEVVQEGVNTVVELDTALVDLQKTTTMSGSQLVSFYEDANDAAKQLGVTTKDIIQSAADWSRLGYSDKNSSQMMAKLAAQFAAISPGVSIEESTTGLVSVMKAYGIEAEEVLDGVMSKINIVGNTAATSNAEIISGLQNSASAMAAMNSTLEENIALFTAAQEIIQDDSKVGNAIRSISMRVRGYDEETGELSEELANITGEVYDLTKATENSQGVSLFTDETQEHYKSVYQYLKDISEVYDDLSEKQQQQLMEKLFGKNRASVGQAILQNFEAAEKAMNNMANSAGNADAEMEIITKSLEYKLNALQETGVGVFQNLFQREDVGVVIDILTKLAEAVDFVTDKLGLFGTVAAGVGIAAFVKNFGSLRSIGELPNILSKISNGIALTKSEVSSMTMAFDAMSVSSRGATIATYELSASQVAASLSGAGLKASEIAAKLALMGYDKEAVVAALKTTGLTESQAEAAVAGLSFAAAEGTATAANNAFTTSLAMATKGLIAFLTTNPVGWAILAAGAIFGLVKLFDALTLSAEEATEQMEESVSAYEEATSQLKSLNNELQTTQDRIDELEAKDSLTFVEESELQKLRESVELLQIQADLAEKESVRKAKDAADDTVTAYRKNFKHDISADAVDEYISTSSSIGLLADESNVSAMLAAIEQFKRLRDELDKDSEYYADDYQHFQGIIDDTTDSLWDQVTVLSTYKSNLEAIPYDELSDEQKQALDEINTAIQLIYQSLDPSKWNEIQWEKISNSDQYKDAVKELTDISTETEITVDTIRSKFPELAQACEDAGVEIESVVNNLNGMRDVQDDTAESIGTYSAQLSDLTKVLSDLQSAYDLLETAQEEMAGGGGLSPDTIADLAEAEENYLDYLYEENGVVKLNTEAWKENADAKMQNEMAEIQKEIDSLEEQNAILEENIKFYKERQAAGNGAAWDNLIAEATADINENTVAIAENQGKLALYSSLYGSITGDLDAYTSALNNFSNIANTIDSVSGSFQTLADLQAQVANGFTMSLDKALEFAKVYPEILNNAQVSANGQITLNEGVVNSFIEGKKAELDAQVDAEIAKLEADKAVLTAKMEFSEAELELAKSVADGEGDITKELAEYRINAGNAVAQALIDAGIDEATAFKLAAAAMAQNAEEFDRVAMEVCTDVNGNFNKAAYDLAQTMYKNLTNVKTDLASVATQAHETAKAIAGVADGSVSGSSGVVGGSGGGVGGSGITLNLTSGSFQGTEYTYTAKESGLEDFISQIELDISNYQDAIAQIDGQIATLQALKNLPLKSFKSSGSGGSGSDSTASEVEEYTAAIDDYREAIERLNRIQTKRTDLETKLSNTNDLRTQIELQKELIGVYEEEQNALHDLNELRDQTIKDGTAALQQLGFDVEYDPDSNLFFVKNLEHLNELVADSKGKYNSLQEATNALRQDTENLINTLGDLNEANQENSESWLELAQAMKEARISIYENTRKESENQIKLSENWLNNAINRPVQVSIPVSVDKSELQELIDSYKEEIATAQELGIDLNKTIYGNIDTNNRQILEWTEENLNKYKDALASWDTTVDEMRGSFSTIFGSSSEYDGIEIAFSPILQTENGPVLLDSHTVDEYIYGLIDKAGEGWTNEKLLQLDTEGLEFDGQIIKNLLADIGDTAIQTGEAMHYVGDLGSISTAYKDIEDAAAAAKMSVDDLNRAIANGSVDNIGTTNVSYYYDVASIETHIAEIVGQYRKMQETIHEEAEYYRSLGYADTSDEVSELSDLWWDYYDKIAETAANAWQQVVDNANDALDRITGIYDTLKDAAQEYADSGFITIDTLQEICSWGVQYLAYLKDENGQLVINEDSIQKVIAARTEQMAVETALSYVQQIRSAIERNEISELMNLTMATEFTTNATWDLVYAQLKLLNVSGDLNDTMYAGALQNINNLRALSGIAITSIGKVEGSVKEANESAKKALQEQSDYLDDLLKYVMAMIKQEVKNQVEALENQIDKMKEIVDLQKKSLDLEREKDEYSKNVAEKTKELAKLQQQLALLELDDSRESLAKQAKLREEIADLSNDLADDQADHAYDAASDMLDDMADAYEKEKKKEIEILENTVSSEEKVYQLA